MMTIAPEKLVFRVTCEDTALCVDIANMHSICPLQKSLFNFQTSVLVDHLMGRKADEQTLLEARKVLEAWSYRLRLAGFHAVEYVRDGRWTWDGEMVG
jgi:hypothetical protein